MQEDIHDTIPSPPPTLPPDSDDESIYDEIIKDKPLRGIPEFCCIYDCYQDCNIV